MMDCKAALPAIAVAALMPLAVSAQDLNIDTSGVLELEYLSGDGMDETYVFGDVSLSYGPNAGQTGLGFDIGLYGLDADGVEGELIAFGALTYRTSYGKFSFGVPRSAASTVSRMPEIGGSQILGAGTQAFNDGLVTLAYLIGDEAPIGLRYDGDYGALKGAVSLHRFDDADVDIADIAVSFDTGRFFVSGAYESVWAPSSSVQSSLHLEIGATGANYEAGIGYTVGSNLIEDALKAWATYQPSSAVAVTASLLDIDGASAIYGISGTYSFASGAYLQGGVVDSSDSDTVFDLSLGYRF